MYKTGDVIMYSSTGICRIESVGPSDIQGMPTDIDYYRLQPLSDLHREMIYIPVNTPAFTRYAITAQQAQRYIDSVRDIEPVTPPGRNPRATQDFYQNLIGSYDTTNLLTVIVSLITKKREVTRLGKKLNQTQVTFLKRRQELICGEFSYVLGLSKEEIAQMIEDNIG